MAISKFAPCPCGSGLKYKKCCWKTKGKKSEAIPSPTTPGIAVETGLDRLSNSVIDLLKDGKIEEAEAACHDLTRKYPDQVDGPMRLAEVHKAKGDKRAAAKCLRQTLEIMESDPESFDPEGMLSVQEEAESLEASCDSEPPGAA